MNATRTEHELMNAIQQECALGTPTRMIDFMTQQMRLEALKQEMEKRIQHNKRRARRRII